MARIVYRLRATKPADDFDDLLSQEDILELKQSKRFRTRQPKQTINPSPQYPRLTASNGSTPSIDKSPCESHTGSIALLIGESLPIFVGHLFRIPVISDIILDLLRRGRRCFGDEINHQGVDDDTKDTNPDIDDPEQGPAGGFGDQDVTEGDGQSRYHAGNSPSGIDPFPPDPRTSTGKKLAAAREKAQGTIWVITPGGSKATRPAAMVATAMEIRATFNRF